MDKTVFKDDFEFASRLCKKDSLALKIIQKKPPMMRDSFIFCSKRLARRTRSFGDGWFYETANKIKVFINDDVMEAYEWLVNYVAKKSCYYRGENNASLITFINFILGPRYKQVRAGWLAHKHGDIRYVPSCIKKLSEEHEEIFRLLKRSNTKEIAQQNSDLSKADFEQLSCEVEKALIKVGKIDVIYPPIMTDLDDNIPQPDVNKPLDLIGKFKHSIKNLKGIDYELFRMKYWDEYTVREMIEYYQSNNKMEELHAVGLSTSRKIYDRLNQISVSILEQVFNRSVKQKKEALEILTIELRRYLDE